jgi:adenylate kinase
MNLNNETLKQAFESKKLISFNTATFREVNVKIVKLNNDDVENKEFTFETSKGERYTRFSNDIYFN